MTKRTDVDIPKGARDAVDERDAGFCRMCGKFLGRRRAIHHINFGGDDQGMGGRRNHAVDNLVSLCWLPGDLDCHQRAHSQKEFWRPLLQQVVLAESNLTAFQLRRWLSKKNGND